MKKFLLLLIGIVFLNSCTNQSEQISTDPLESIKKSGILSKINSLSPSYSELEYSKIETLGENILSIPTKTKNKTNQMVPIGFVVIFTNDKNKVIDAFIIDQSQVITDNSRLQRGGKISYLNIEGEEFLKIETNKDGRNVLQDGKDTINNPNIKGLKVAGSCIGDCYQTVKNACQAESTCNMLCDLMSTHCTAYILTTCAAHCAIH
jgi:hypothetical protein